MKKISLLTISLVFSSYIKADEYYLQALENFKGDINISALINENFLEGNYKISFYINDIKKLDCDLYFKNTEKKLHPEITLHQLKNLGVITEYYDELKNKKNTDVIDHNILADIFKMKINLNNQEFFLKVPTIALNNGLDTLRENWDDGINASFINYDYYGNYFKNRQGTSSGEHFHNLVLYNGININLWRFRQTLNYNNRERKLSIEQQYIYRSLKELNSTLTLGDFYTYIPNLNTYRLIGIQLNKDTSMLSPSFTGYAPIIKETTSTYADVIIEKDGMEIYRISVPPGPFILDKIPAIGFDGELMLIIKEENNNIRKIKIWSFLSPNLLREKQWNYYFSAGLINDNYHKNKKELIQINLAYGVNNRLTTYSGLEKKGKTLDVFLGTTIGLNALGIISLEANWKQNNKFILYNLKYATTLPYTNTNLSFNSSFYNLKNKPYENNKKYESGFILSQNLTNSVSIRSGYNITSYYLNKEKYFFISGASDYKKLSYSIEFQDKQNIYSNHDRKIYISLNYPLVQRSSHWIMIRSIYRDKEKSFYNNLSFNGGNLLNNRLNYGISLSKNDKGNIDTSISTHYLSRISSMKFNTQINQNSHYFSYGVSGGIVFYRNSIILSQTLNDSFAIINYNGAKKIRNQGNLTTESDNRGYSIIPYLESYRENKFYIDANSLNNKYDTDDYSYHFTPTKGAIVYKFINIKSGAKALFTINKNIPFGAIANIENSDKKSSEAFYINDNNQLYMSNLPIIGKVNIRWGIKKEQQCYFNYKLNKSDLKNGFYFKEVNCQNLD